MQEQIEEYKKFITELVQKQMVVLGPNIALDKARKAAGLSVADDGSVLELSGDPQMVLKSVANEYIELSGSIAWQSINPLLAKYPTVKIL